MDAREELIAAIEAHQWSESFNSAHREHQYSSWCAICKGDVRAVVDALLADGRWVLVHPDEVPEYEQVGIVAVRTTGGLGIQHDPTWKLREGTAVYARRPAVEKENDQ